MYTVKESVYETIQRNPSITRYEIAKVLGLRTNSATARVRELIIEGLIVVDGYTFCTSSNKKVQTLRAC